MKSRFEICCLAHAYGWWENADPDDRAAIEEAIRRFAAMPQRDEPIVVLYTPIRESA